MFLKICEHNNPYIFSRITVNPVYFLHFWVVGRQTGRKRTHEIDMEEGNVQQFVYVILSGLYSIQGRPETWGRPGQANHLAPLQTDVLKTFSAWERTGEYFGMSGSKLQIIFLEILSFVETTDYSSDVVATPLHFGASCSCPAGPLLRPVLTLMWQGSATVSPMAKREKLSKCCVEWT